MAFTITPEQREYGLSQGRKRFDNAKRVGAQNWGGSRSDADQLEQDQLGCIGEIVSAAALNLAYDSSIGNYDGIDLSNKIEVRARWDVFGRNQLPLRPAKKDQAKLHLPFLLVRINRAMDEAMLVGWLLGREAMWLIKQQPGNRWWNEPSRCWYIPDAHLHSIYSLQDWLWVGAPLHTWQPPEPSAPSA